MYLLCLFLAALSLSCKEKEEIIEEASLELKITQTSSSSVTFSITPDKNTVAYSYACVKSEELSSANFTRVESPDYGEYTIENLEPDTEYTILANAENKAGAISDNISEEFVTTSAPSIKIKVTEVIPNKVTFTLTPLNAVSMIYACVPSSEAETAELTNTIESGKEETVTLDVNENTQYAIVAQAKNESGELSEKAFSSFRTGEGAKVEITEIESDEVSATVKITHSGASNIYYALTNANEEPAEYKKITASSTYPSALYFYDLNEGSQYTVHIYADNKDGFETEPVKQSFTAEAPAQPKDLTVKVSNITYRDADVQIEYNTEKIQYCQAYVKRIIDGTLAINPSEFDWDAAITNKQTTKIDESGNTHKLNDLITSFAIGNGNTTAQNAHINISDDSRSNLTIEGKYFLGITGIDKDGNVVSESSVWKEIQLDNVTFGESEVSLTIEDIEVGFDSYKYKVISNGATAYYIKWVYDNPEDPEATAKTMLPNKVGYTSSFERTQTFENLEQNREISIIAIPEDENGLLGEVVIHQIKTKEVVFDGNAKTNVSLTRKSMTTLHYNIEFDENTASFKYIHFSSDDATWSDEQYAQNRLLKAKENTEPLNIDLTNLEQDKEYQLWVLPIDKEGRMSEIIKIKNKTDAALFEGNAGATITIDEFTNSGFQSKVKYTITPDESAVGFYHTAWSMSNINSLDDKALAAYLMNSGTYSTEKVSVTGKDGSGMQIFGKEIGVVVITVDKDGKYSKPFHVEAK